jgi:hypothetical protein
MWGDVERRAKTGVTNTVNMVKGWAQDIWNLAGQVHQKVVAFIENMWGDLERRTVTGVSNVVRWFESLPGKILGALGNLGSDMFSAGEHAISMLINGLKSIPVVGTMISIAGDIADHLPHSPAKKGPLSGSGSPDVAGQNIARMLTAGLASGRPGVQAAMAHLTSGGIGSGGAGMAGAGAGGTVTHVVQLQFAGGSDDLLTRWFREKVRTVGGGSVQRAFGNGTG